MKEVFHLFDEENEQYYWFLFDPDSFVKNEKEDVEGFDEFFESSENFMAFMYFMQTGDNPKQFFNYPSGIHDFVGVHEVDHMENENNITISYGYASPEIENFQKAIELWFEFFKSYNLVDENTTINISNDEDEMFKEM